MFELPLYFPPRVSATREYSVLGAFTDAALTLTLPIVLGLILWFFPAKVTNKIVFGEKLAGERFGVRDFERVALTVVGTWLVVYGIADLIYTISSMVVTERIYREYTNAESPLRQYVPGIITNAAKVVLGVGLALGAKGIARLMDRARG